MDADDPYRLLDPRPDPQRHGRLPPARSSPLVPLLLLAAVGLLAWQVFGPRLRRAFDPDAEPRAVTARGELAPAEQSTIALYQAASPAVVHVTNVGLRQNLFTMDVFAIPQGTGTGFVWDEQGYIVTNAHVVRGGQQFQVKLTDDSVWKAELVGADPSHDIAVLRVSGAPVDKLRALPLGTSSDLKVGQTVLAIGNPFGLDQTLTTGVISGLGRQIEADGGQVIRGVIQTDAAINPGNSGGPLLDSAGRLIGMNTAILSPSRVSAGIGFAVPVDTINRIVPLLIRGEKPPRAGLGVSLAPDAFVRRRGLVGALIGGLVPGGSAEKAGLRGMSEDPERGATLLGDLIVAVEGKPVRSNDELAARLSGFDVGREVSVTVERDGARRDVKVTLQAVAAR